MRKGQQGKFHGIPLLALLLALVLFAAGCGKSESGQLLKTADDALKARDYQAAHDGYDRLIENGMSMQLAYRGRGIASMGLGDYEAARDDLLKSLEEGGVFVSDISYDINFYLASCEYKLGNTQEAIRIYDSILKLRPTDIDALQLRGSARLGEGLNAAAREDFEKVLRLAPADYDRIIEMSENLRQYGMVEEGKALLNRTLADQDRSLSNYDRGRLCFYLEDYQTAKSCLEQARMNSGDYRTSAMLGRTYEELGDYNYAISVYETYLETDKSHAEIYNRLGLCHMKMQNYQDALRAFEQGKLTEDAQVLQDLSYNEIVAHEFLGEWKKASLLMETYLQNYPNDETAKREYIFLKTR
ncbi:MAG: tetratricopeptide repeat protein [Lachnospiraceae bacterium]|nr:tetratricopeptide repeat protein [Lachnospiraceae bacterium]